MLQGKASGGGGDTMVGTWIFNEVLDITLDGTYPINISANVWGTTYEFIGLIFFDGACMGVLDDTDGNYSDCYEDGDWYAPQIFNIIEEPTDPVIIEWIKANARKATYEDGFAEGEKAILSTYIDWSVSTTSSSCIVDFYNDCDYYAHIHLYVERLSGDGYGEDIVLSPREELTITNGDMGWSGLSGEEWTVQVTIEGFSKDGEL